MTFRSIRAPRRSVEAAVDCEPCFTNNGPNNSSCDPVDYLTTAVGSIRTASSELDDLLKLLDRTPEGGAA